MADSTRKDEDSKETGAKPAAGQSARDTLGIFVTRIADRPLSIIVSLISAIYLGPIDKGLAAWITVLLLTSSTILNFGCATAAKYFVSKNDQPLKGTAVTTMMIGLANGLFAAGLIGVLTRLDLLGSLSAELPTPLTVALLVMLPLMTVRQLMFFSMMGDAKFRIVNTLELTTSLLYSALMALLVIVLNLGLTGAVVALFVANATTSLAAITIVFRVYVPRLVFDWGYCRKVYAYGIRGWVGQLSKQMNLSLDSLIVGLVSPAAVLGNYSVAVTISRGILVLPLSLILVLSNRVVKLDRPSAIQLAARLHRVIIAAVIGLSLAAAVVGAFVLPIIMPSYTELPSVLVVLLIGTVLMASYSVMGSYFVGRGMPGRPSIAHLFAFLIGGLATPFLTAAFGGVGAATGCVLTYAITAFVLYLFFRKQRGEQKARLLFLNRDDLHWLRDQLSAGLGGIKRRQSKPQLSGSE